MPLGLAFTVTLALTFWHFLEARKVWQLGLFCELTGTMQGSQLTARPLVWGDQINVFCRTSSQEIVEELKA